MPQNKIARRTNEIKSKKSVFFFHIETIPNKNSAATKAHRRDAHTHTHLRWFFWLNIKHMSRIFQAYLHYAWELGKKNVIQWYRDKHTKKSKKRTIRKSLHIPAGLLFFLCVCSLLSIPLCFSLQFSSSMFFLFISFAFWIYLVSIFRHFATVRHWHCSRSSRHKRFSVDFELPIVSFKWPLILNTIPLACPETIMLIITTKVCVVVTVPTWLPRTILISKI